MVGQVRGNWFADEEVFQARRCRLRICDTSQTGKRTVRSGCFYAVFMVLLCRPAHTGQVRDSRPAPTILGAYATAIGSVAVIVWAPAIVGFGLALLGATTWCLWLERYTLT